MIKYDASDDEIDLLLKVIFETYGYDFTQYSRAHVQRRINNRMMMSDINISELRHLVLTNVEFAAQLLQDLSITVTEMFRDPAFYRSLREHVIPILKTYPYIKIWHAGCSSGEEAYSMAVLLTEEGLYDRCTIYATDFNQQALDKARAGIFSHELIKEYTLNYQHAGGNESFSGYYTSDSQKVIMNQKLKKNIVWANHNLVTDGIFAEVHLILCRNVLIYFNRDLQNKVQKLFFDSLVNGGILCLGSKESIALTDVNNLYTEIDKKHRIFKRKYTE